MLLSVEQIHFGSNVFTVFRFALRYSRLSSPLIPHEIWLGQRKRQECCGDVACWQRHECTFGARTPCSVPGQTMFLDWYLASHLWISWKENTGFKVFSKWRKLGRGQLSWVLGSTYPGNTQGLSPRPSCSLCKVCHQGPPALWFCLAYLISSLAPALPYLLVLIYLGGTVAILKTYSHKPEVTWPSLIPFHFGVEPPVFIFKFSSVWRI